MAKSFLKDRKTPLRKGALMGLALALATPFTGCISTPKYKTNLRPVSTAEKTIPSTQLGQAQRIAGTLYVFQNIKDDQTAFIDGKEVTGELPFYAIPYNEMTQTVGEDDVTFTPNEGSSAFVFPRFVRTSKLEKKFGIGDHNSTRTLTGKTNKNFQRNANGQISIPESTFDTFVDPKTKQEYFLIENPNGFKVGNEAPKYFLIPADPSQTSQAFNYQDGKISLIGPAYAPMQGTVGRIPQQKPQPKTKNPTVFNGLK